MKAVPIPVVSTSMAHPFILAIETRGHDPLPLLKQADLERHDLEEEDAFMPGQTWYDLANAAAVAAGDPNLGFTIGATEAFEALPNLRILRLPRATLGELLTALVIDARRVTTLARYALRIEGTEALLETRRTFRPTSVPAQVDGYFAGFMLQILKTCSGTAWDPARLSMQLSEPNAVPRKEFAHRPKKDVKLTGAWFRFPSDWLLQRSDGTRWQVPQLQMARDDGFMQGFEALLGRHLHVPALTRERFAELAGVSVGTLKRALAAHGTSFQKEHARVRTARAKLLLRTSGTSVTDIATQLGFADTAAFSHAFRRWTGMSPVAFRNAASHIT